MGSDFTFNRSSEIINTNSLSYRKLYKAVLTSESMCSVGDLVLVYTSGNNLIPAIVISTDPFSVGSFNPLNLINANKTFNDSSSQIENVEMYTGSVACQLLVRPDGTAIAVGKSSVWSSVSFYKNEFGMSDTPSISVYFIDTEGNRHEGYSNTGQGYWVGSEKMWYTDLSLLEARGYVLEEESDDDDDSEDGGGVDG